MAKKDYQIRVQHHTCEDTFWVALYRKRTCIIYSAHGSTKVKAVNQARKLAKDLRIKYNPRFTVRNGC